MHASLFSGIFSAFYAFYKGNYASMHRSQATVHVSREAFAVCKDQTLRGGID